MTYMDGQIVHGRKSRWHNNKGGCILDDRLFRNAMGSFATGVTIITTEWQGETHGMTANAFMSVSLTPKLVVISIDEHAHMFEKIKKSKKFAVNILAENQQDLSMHFAGQRKVDYRVSFNKLSGLPVIDGAIAQIACEVSGEHVEGDHILFIGKVVDIHLEDKRPLIFYQGKYQSLQPVEKIVNS